MKNKKVQDTVWPLIKSFILYKERKKNLSFKIVLIFVSSAFSKIMKNVEILLK